ncbi:MAG: universal stress protein [Myxococcaceae bacterium]|jgi:nucleotide-binding universal stress UspA family protein|nr:universal stress protein [Myxococcaceae bacterium]
MAKLLSSVLVPTDFSPGAQVALERALHLPLAPRAKVTLLHVLPAGIPGRLRADAIADAERSLEKHLAQVRALAVERGVAPAQFVGDVVEGAAAHHVMKRANAVEADVICIGRHGRRGVVDLFLGSTVTKVVRQTEHPVLLAQRKPTGPYVRPLFALDPTHAALTVARQGLRVLAPATKRVTVAHATPIPYEDFVSVSADQRIALRKQFEKDGERALTALLKRLPGVHFDAVVKSGDARTLLVEQAQALDADLLVLGSHGRGSVARFLVGSVAEWVLANATSDVLVVRP